MRYGYWRAHKHTNQRVPGSDYVVQIRQSWNTLRDGTCNCRIWTWKARHYCLSLLQSSDIWSIQLCISDSIVATCCDFSYSHLWRAIRFMILDKVNMQVFSYRWVYWREDSAGGWFDYRKRKHRTTYVNRYFWFPNLRYSPNWRLPWRCRCPQAHLS